MQEISSGVVVYFKEGHKILYLTLHYESGHWDFPKGHVEENEKLEETALRETKEETNLDVDLQENFKKALSYFYRRDGLLVSKTVYFFLGQTNNKKVKISSEHSGFKWLIYEDALELLTFDNAKEVLKKAHEFLTQRTLADY